MTRHHLIGLAGYAQSGKDTTAAVLALDGYTKVAFADALRAMMERLNPLVCVRQEVMDFYKNPDYEYYNVLIKHRSYEWVKAHTNAREFMVALGAGAREILDPDVWINAAESRILDAFRDGAGKVVISDVRYPNEAKMILSHGGTLWYINRPGVGPANDEEKRTIFELVQGYYPKVINNCGSLDDLAVQVRAALR